MEFIDSVSKAKASSPKASKEKNDCVVRAIMSSFDVSYDEAYEWVQENLQRKKNKGVFFTEQKLFKMYENKQLIFNKHLKFLGNSPKEQKKQKYIASKFKIELVNENYTHKPVAYTVATFVEKYNKGSYLILVNGHALCIKDGTLYDNPSYNGFKGLRRPIEQAFQVI